MNSQLTDESFDIWDKIAPQYKEGKKKLAAWHEECRHRRLQRALLKRKEEHAKKLALYISSRNKILANAKEIVEAAKHKGLIREG